MELVIVAHDNVSSQYVRQPTVVAKIFDSLNVTVAATIRRKLVTDATPTRRPEGTHMLRWLAKSISHHATPEKQAERALHELRMGLFQAEQRLLDAQLQADYFRSHIAFCEEVLKTGIEQVSDHRKGQHDTTSPELRPNLKLTASQ
jgi:hypothetical protein